MAPYLTKWIAQKKGRNAVNLGTGTPVRGTSLQQIIREDLVAWMATADFEACKPHLENAFRDSAIRSIPRSKEHVASSLLEATAVGNIVVQSKKLYFAKGRVCTKV